MRQILIDKPEGAGVVPFLNKDTSTGFVYIQRELPKLDYFWIDNLEDEEGEVVFSLQGSSNTKPVTLEYSIDRGENWTEFNTSALTSSNRSLSIVIPTKTTMYLRGNNECFGVSSSIYTKISCSKQHNIGGNLISLLSKDLVEPGTLPSYCFEYLFNGNTNLVDASKLIMLSKTSNYCYYHMFHGCTSLTTAPSILPATTLTNNCYSYMFSGCTSLTTVPELPATVLTDYCYFNMFSGCTSLTTAPELPATTLANYCYRNMFSGCTSLTTAHKLPATTLADSCYYEMFKGCTSLTTAPELPATTLAHNCYLCMFTGCTSLTTAHKLPATTLADGCYYEMFKGCTSLTAAPELPATTLADSCYKNMFNGCTSLTTAPELPATTVTNYCYQYMFQGCTSLTTAPELHATTLADYCCQFMFYGCTALTTAPELPATTLASYCYNAMFQGCTSLTTTPELPATTLASSCYSSMFYGCTSLTTMPELPATTLTGSCYSYMFYGCTSLTTALELSATTLAQNCYHSMFYNCKSLTNAPELPATTLTYGCYQYMFYGCTNINYVKALFTSKQSDSLTNWLSGTASIGILIKNPTANWNASDINLPSGWIIRDTDNYTITVNYKTIDGDILYTETISDKFINASTFTPNATIDGYIYDNSELEILNDGQIFNILIYIPVTYTVTRKYQDEKGNALKEDDTISYIVGIGEMNEVVVEPSSESIDVNGDTYRFEKIQTVLMDNTEVTFIGYQTIISWSGNWTIDESTYGYPCYRSNTITHSQSTVQRLTFKGVGEIVIKMISKGENAGDYLTYGNIDTPCSRANRLGTLWKTSGTWQTVTFTPTDYGEHYIEFCYSKDSSRSTAPDCAWVYIESINGNEINGVEM